MMNAEKHGDPYKSAQCKADAHLTLGIGGQAPRALICNAGVSTYSTRVSSY